MDGTADDKRRQKNRLERERKKRKSKRNYRKRVNKENETVRMNQMKEEMKVKTGIITTKAKETFKKEKTERN